MTDDAYKKGLEIRHAMFGQDVTDRQIENANQFTRPMQDVVSKYCFGETWAREGLSLRDRSLVTVAALCAMGRAHELKIHVKGALANGISPLEIRELLLHTMVYAGVPLGVTGILSAAESLAEEGVDLDAIE